MPNGGVHEPRLSEFTQRPSEGRLGKSIRIRSNFFEVLSFPEQNIIHYDVTITPDVPPALNRKIYEVFERENLVTALNNIRVIFDGRKNVFAPQYLPFGEAATFEVTLPEEDGTTSARRAPRIFRIKMKKAGEIVMGELHKFLDGQSSLTPNCLSAIMVLDVLIRHLPSMKNTTVGRSFFTKHGTTALSGGVEVWQGYYQSARPTKGKMLINVDLSATAFYEAGPLVTIVVKILGRRSVDDLHRGISDRDRIKLEKALKNLKIRVIHRGKEKSKRRFKIIKVTPTPANQTRFDMGDGQTVDVANYFAKTYNYRLTYSHLPCIVVKKDVFLPLEVCEVIEGQRYTRKFDDKQTADMIKFTCQPPHMRANKINQGVEILNYRGNEYLQQFGMNVSNDMIVAPARIIPTPTLQYHPSSREPVLVPREGSWNLRDKKVAQGATLGSWSIITFGSDQEFPLQSVQAFLRELIITCQDNGMNIPNKTPPIMHANPQGDVESVLKAAWLHAGNAAKAQPQLIVCILPNTGVPLYAEIKRVTDTVIGIASQCIQSRHMMQAKKQYCANICLKINVKLGGMNVFISPSQIPFITDCPTILMGADISHPSP
ncbi:675_t:CDS:2, partial [Scutellospora calospora]